MNAELAAHPLNQVARVLAWGALGLLAYGATSWLVARPWFALTTLEVTLDLTQVTQTNPSFWGTNGAPAFTPGAVEFT